MRSSGCFSRTCWLSEFSDLLSSPIRLAASCDHTRKLALHIALPPPQAFPLRGGLAQQRPAPTLQLAKALPQLRVFIAESFEIFRKKQICEEEFARFFRAGDIGDCGQTRSGYRRRLLSVWMPTTSSGERS